MSELRGDSITDSLRASYDEVPYPSLAYAQSHPDTLATIARLSGMTPAPVEHCRVLELGCASGGNLLPMADALPGSEFVGLDLSHRQISDGQAVVRELGLQNLRLETLSILDVGSQFGVFDYIIAHGVYSWVPADVQDKILAICRESLTPQGEAFISYNVSPGWKLLGAIRDMLLYRTRHGATPTERVTQAREMLAFMKNALDASDEAHGLLMTAYHQFLTRELEYVQELGDAYLLHDELEGINQPFYFFEFVQRASAHSLRYLADADMRIGLPSQFTDNVAQQIRAMAHTQVDVEQYVDFLANRMFRRSLLCHAGVALERTMTSDRLDQFCFTTSADRASQSLPAASAGAVRFVAGDGSTFETDHQLTVAAFQEMLACAPVGLSMPELLARARDRLAGAVGLTSIGSNDVVLLNANLLKAFAISPQLVELHAFAPSLARRVTERPVAPRLARLHARAGSLVTNAYHVRVQLPTLAREIVPLLDGSRNRADLVECLVAGPIARGTLTLDLPPPPPHDASRLYAVVSSEVDACLDWLFHAALLVE